MSNDETAPKMLMRLGTNAMLWAQEFNKTAVKLGYSEMDEGWLIGWFANAIENCDVVRCNPIRDDLAAVTEERDRMRKALKLALEYWGHRQSRYKNRHPVWVLTARDAIEGVTEKKNG